MALSNSKVYGVSYTEEQEKWLNEQYGMSYNPNSENYFGKVYADTYENTVASAGQTLANSNQSMANVYGQTMNTAKLTQNNAVNNYQNAYKTNAIAANSQMQTMASVYGSNQSRLAQMGLTGSGYNAAVMGNIYGNYQAAKSNAYNTAEQGKMTAAQIYGASEMNANNTLTQGQLTAQQLYGDSVLQAQQTRDTNIAAKNAEITAAYKTKQSEYTTNTAALQNALDTDTFSIADAKYLLDTDGITQDTYDKFVKKYQDKVGAQSKKTYDTLTNTKYSDTAEGIAQKEQDYVDYFTSIDNQYESGELSESEYNKIYYQSARDLSDYLSLANYDDIYTAITEDKSKMTKAQYTTAIRALNTKYSNIYSEDVKSRINNEIKESKTTANVEAIIKEIESNKNKLSTATYNQLIREAESAKNTISTSKKAIRERYKNVSLGAG